jgi:hypothetical protein
MAALLAEENAAVWPASRLMAPVNALARTFATCSVRARRVRTGRATSHLGFSLHARKGFEERPSAAGRRSRSRHIRHAAWPAPCQPCPEPAGPCANDSGCGRGVLILTAWIVASAGVILAVDWRSQDRARHGPDGGADRRRWCPPPLRPCARAAAPLSDQHEAAAPLSRKSLRRGADWPPLQSRRYLFAARHAGGRGCLISSAVARGRET